MPGCVEHFEEHPHLVRRESLSALDLSAAQVVQRLGQEVVEAGVAFVEAPPDDARPGGGRHVVHEPVPGEGALAETAQRAQDQQRMRGVRVQPAR